jgi:hypothetical protein
MNPLSFFKRKQKDISGIQLAIFLLIAVSQKRWFYSLIWAAAIILVGWLLYVYLWSPFQFAVSLPAQVMEGNPEVDIEAIKSINEARAKRINHSRSSFEEAERVFKLSIPDAS